MLGHLDRMFLRHQDVSMRTTLTLDPDVAALLESDAHRRQVSFKQAVNDAIRRGLSRRPSRSEKPYRVLPHKTRLRAGIDASGFNKLADELEDEATLSKSTATK